MINTTLHTNLCEILFQQNIHVPLPFLVVAMLTLMIDHQEQLLSPIDLNTLKALLLSNFVVLSL